MAGRRRFVLALAAAASLTCGTSSPPPPAHAFPVQEFTLPSGLRVVVEQDDVSTIAGVVVIVDVGAVDDPAGKVGMAHVLEHLVFRVPDESGVSVWRRLHKLGAASFNAHTAMERTTYHAFGPRQTLDELAATLLGRLADPLRGARDVHVAKEVSITAEEQRRREGASGWEHLVPSLLPAGDPVGQTWRAIRRSDPLSLADVQAFAARTYRPERMTVVISGPVPAGWEKTFIASLPASLRGEESARRAPVRRPPAAFGEPPPGDAALPPHVAKVNYPELWIGWRVPPSVGIAGDKLAVVTHVIQSVLSKRLDVDGTNDVLDVSGLYLTGSLSSVVGCRFRLRAAADAARIDKEATAALEALADPTMVAIKGRLRWSNQYALQAATLRTALGMEGIQGRAMVRADLVHSGSSALISNVLGTLEKMTTDEITDFAARYLKPSAARSVLIVPEAMPAGRAGGAIAGRTDSAARPGAEADDDLERYDEDDVDRPDDAKLAEITQAPGARAALVRTLPNGLTVIALRRPGLPFASMLLGFHADPQPGDAPGARVAFARVLRWDLSSAPIELGLLRSTGYYADQTVESLSMFSADVGKAFDFLSEEADSLHVFWPHPAFERWVTGNGVWEATPEGRAAHGFRTALFGNHPYHLMPGTPVVRKVTEAEVQSWFDRVRRPANGALVVVGEIDAEGIIRDAGRALSGWKGDAAAPPPPPAPPPPRAATPASLPALVRTRDPRRKSADVRFGCFLPPVCARRDAVVNSVLSDLLEQRLFQRLRWDLGVTYSADVDSDSLRGGTAWFTGRVDIDAQALPRALDLLHAWLDAGRPSPIEPETFEEIRWDKARRSGMMNVTGEEMARSLFYAWNMGWQPAVLDDYPHDLAGVTLADVTSALDVCRRSAVISVLAPDQD